MNTSRIAFEYLSRSSSISSVATSLNLCQKDIVPAILNFMRTHPESSYNEKIFKKLVYELIGNFLLSNINADYFAEEYGLRTIEFIKLATRAIDDTNIIHSDALADKIYRQLLHERASLGKFTPKRIIKIMAERYISDTWITQSAMALSYGISRCSVGYLLNRGIEEKILSPTLAEAVQIKSCNRQSVYIKKNPY